MEADAILREAWAAVEKSGVPESVHEAAFKEAVRIVRGDVPGTSMPGAEGPGERIGGSPGEDGPPDESAFFAELSRESGVSEKDLRDVLHLTADRKVQVTPPTKDLGTSVAAQAKSVIALVAGARSHGLGERPVDAEAVRQEVERKRCYQSNNFAASHLGPMRGFNAGSNRNEILLTSRWVDEFKAAVAQARGEKPGKDET